MLILHPQIKNANAPAKNCFGQYFPFLGFVLLNIVSKEAMMSHGKTAGHALHLNLFYNKYFIYELHFGVSK